MTPENKVQLTTAVVNALLLVIPAVAGYIIYKLNKLSNRLAENSKTTDEVKVLVNSKFGVLLTRLSGTLDATARLTENPIDIDKAEQAKKEVEAHEKATLQEQSGAKA